MRDDTFLGQEQNEERALTVDIVGLLGSFFRYALRYWWVAVCCVAVCVAAVCGVYRFTYEPMYRCSATFTLSAGEDSGSYSFYYSESTATQMSKTFPYILESRYFRSVLLDTMGRGSINGTLSADTLENSNIVTMTMESPDADDALAFLEAAISVYPRVARFVLGNIKFYMIEEAAYPAAPYNSVPVVNLILLGTVAGVLVACLIYLAISLLRKKVTSSEDLKPYTNINCLAYLPAVKMPASSRRKSRSILVDSKRISKAYIEAMNTLTMRIERDMEKSNAKSLLVTGTVDGNGKTTTAVNLALSLTKLGKRVLMLDGNMRKPGCAELLDAAFNRGLDELNEDPQGLLKAAVQTGKENLWLLGCNKCSEASASILSSKAMRELVELAEKEYDYVIIDSPACGLYQDAQLLMDFTDSVLYVIKYDCVSLVQVRRGLNIIDSGNAKLIGYAFNQCPEYFGDYGYGRYGYGQYGYGYGYGYSKYGYERYGYDMQVGIE